MEISFTGTIEGEDTDPLTGENVLCEVGGETTVKEFTEHLMGGRPGEEKDFEVQYNAEHPDPTLSGKTIHYAIRLGSLKQKSRPPLDDDFAQSAAVADLERAFVAQHLLDRGLHERRLGAQPRHLVGKTEQEIEAVGNQHRGGVVSGVEQEDAVVHQLEFGEPVGRVVIGEQRGQDVGLFALGEPAALPGDQAARSYLSSRLKSRAPYRRISKPAPSKNRKVRARAEVCDVAAALRALRARVSRRRARRARASRTAP